VVWLLPTAIGSALMTYNLGGLRTGRVQVPSVERTSETMG